MRKGKCKDEVGGMRKKSIDFRENTVNIMKASYTFLNTKENCYNTVLQTVIPKCFSVIEVVTVTL